MADRDAPVAATAAPPSSDSPARPARALGTPLVSVIAVVTTLIGLAGTIDARQSELA